MAEDVATLNRIIGITPGGSWVPGTASGHTYTETPGKIQAPIGIGNEVLINQISWVAVGCTLPSYNFVSGSGLINASATKCSSTGPYVMRKDDNGNCTGSFDNPSPPYDTIPCSCVFNIDNPGQDKMSAN